MRIQLRFGPYSKVFNLAVSANIIVSLDMSFQYIKLHGSFYLNTLFEFLVPQHIAYKSPAGFMLF